MGVKEKTLGVVRYFTYYMYFPVNKGHAEDYWVDSIPFVHDLDFEFKRCGFIKGHPERARDLLHKGECRWADDNKVIHRVVITDKPEQRIWGSAKGNLRRSFELHSNKTQGE